MTFKYIKVGGDKSEELQNLVYGSILMFSGHFVEDDGLDIIFLDLGGAGSTPPISGTPSYYNLIWQGMPVAFEGFYKMTGPAGHQIVKLTVTKFLAPNKSAELIDDIKKAIEDAYACYWSGRFYSQITAQVQFPTIQFY